MLISIKVGSPALIGLSIPAALPSQFSFPFSTVIISNFFHSLANAALSLYLSLLADNFASCFRAQRNHWTSPLISSQVINPFGTSLMVQWLSICLLMQGTQVRSLVWDAMGQLSPWAITTKELVLCNKRSHGKAAHGTKTQSSQKKKPFGSLFILPFFLLLQWTRLISWLMPAIFWVLNLPFWRLPHQYSNIHEFPFNSVPHSLLFETRLFGKCYLQSPFAHLICPPQLTPIHHPMACYLGSNVFSALHRNCSY